MTFRYIGSKARLTSPLSRVISSYDNCDRFVDAFCGTGAVSEVAGLLGRDVWANDTMVSATIMTAARLLSHDQVSFSRLDGYDGAINRLNQTPARTGYFHRTYSPASALHAGTARRYFTEENAARIDAMRSLISDWREGGDISPDEEKLLLADLIAGVNRCANIAGTYGCFLSKWQSAALRPIVLQPRLLKDFATELDTTTHDVADLVTAENDLVYLDPPYTKRQYASYYHIIETLVLGDEPRVEGVSGLRPWQHKASAFCYKRRALDALVSLVENIGSRHVILSYSAEGHVDLLELEEMLSRSGKIVTTPIEEVGRYRPNRSASANGDTVTEYILTYARRGARKSSPMPRNVILEGATA
ncbi:MULTISPECIES: DNA adenine methylase [Sphingomonadaceae]|uniref:site-specific DNA-methyltransferase (adenine-specific) n=1 Tax=Novosphingobium guangzhouense TaxID=1850347 RepID=A0A2K2FVI5_9SPHN|nr:MULTISPECIES: DNA adenine methylase [Sphingomonadaceae]ETI59599.1 DNA methyltransferase [Sphingobium sp. C100]PNU02807.1 hypothetical protein A8V01_25330 [Novosphingobium guangzhouense]